MYQQRSKIILFILGVLLVIGVIGGFTWANYRYAKENPGGHEFLTNWIAFRQIMNHGENPYSDSMALEIQKQVEAMAPSHIPISYRFTTPLYAIVFYFPFALIPDFIFARAMWMTLLEILLIAVALISLRVVNARMSLFETTALVLFLIFWFHGVSALLSGNHSVLVTFFMITAVWAIQNREEELAGVLLAFSTIKPQMVFFVLLFILIWSLRNGKQKTGVWMAATLFFLIVATLLLRSDWVFQNFRSAINAVRDNFVYNPAIALSKLIPGIGMRMGWILSATAVVFMVIEWFRFRSEHPRAFLWVICFTLATTFLSGIPNGYGNELILFLIVPLILLLVIERWGNAGKWIGWFLIIVLFFSGWLIYLFTRASWMQDAFLFLPVPVLGLFLLYWVREWAMETFKPWFDLLMDRD